MPGLPLFHADAASKLSFIAKALGYPIFLSGGAAVWTQGGTRPVKDLDFRIALPFNWRSSSGQRLMSDFNTRMRIFDGRVKEFRINDVHTGHTILGEFLDVEVSISNSTLPLNAPLERHSQDLLETMSVISLDDNIFDKMLSLMFRHKSAKEMTDMVDLCTLLTLSEKHPVYYVRHFFVRRGAAYAFSSKPAEIQRHLGHDLNLVGLRKLIDDPESLMLEEFRGKLADLEGRFKLQTKALRTAWAVLREVADLAVQNKPARISLSKVTPPQGVVRSRNIADPTPGVVARRTARGSWEV